MLFWRLLFLFFVVVFSKNSFRYTIRVSNCLDSEIGLIIGYQQMTLGTQLNFCMLGNFVCFFVIRIFFFNFSTHISQEFISTKCQTVSIKISAYILPAMGLNCLGQNVFIS